MAFRKSYLLAFSHTITLQCNQLNVLKFQTLLSFCSQIKYWLSCPEFHKILVRIANSEDPYQTAF